MTERIHSPKETHKPFSACQATHVRDARSPSLPSLPRRSTLVLCPACRPALPTKHYPTPSPDGYNINSPGDSTDSRCPGTNASPPTHLRRNQQARLDSGLPHSLTSRVTGAIDRRRIIAKGQHGSINPDDAWCFPASCGQRPDGRRPLQHPTPIPSPPPPQTSSRQAADGRGAKVCRRPSPAPSNTNTADVRSDRATTRAVPRQRQRIAVLRRPVPCPLTWCET